MPSPPPSPTNRIVVEFPRAEFQRLEKVAPSQGLSDWLRVVAVRVADYELEQRKKEKA